MEINNYHYTLDMTRYVIYINLGRLKRLRLLKFAYYWGW